MLVIGSSGITSVVCTLYENSILSANTSYLFSLNNSETNRNTVFCSTDTSLFPKIYNEFSIVNTGQTEQNMYDAVVYLPIGSYRYNIYENPNSLTATTGLNCVETGILKVTGATDTIKEYTGLDDITFSTYNQ